MEDCILTIEDIERAMAILKEAPKYSSIFNPYASATIDADYRGHIPIENINPCAEMTIGGLEPVFTTEYHRERPLFTTNYNTHIECAQNTFENWLENVNNQKLEGGNTMFNVNDEVIVVKNEYNQFVDMEGVIKEVTKSNNGLVTYGVVIKKLKVGHDLDGKCPFGQGWYFLEEEIDLLHKSKLCRMIKKNEELLKTIKDFGKVNLSTGGGVYEIRKNGALTFLTHEGRKVFVYKDGATSPLTLNCISEDDKIVTLHLMEAFRILPMMGLVPVLQTSGMTHILQSYTQEESDIQEALMFPTEVEPVEGTPVPPVAKVYASEEELMADLGMI